MSLTCAHPARVPLCPLLPLPWLWVSWREADDIRDGSLVFLLHFPAASPAGTFISCGGARLKRSTEVLCNL